MIQSMNSTIRTLPTSVTVYGIPNCDTVKKARVWLSDHGLEVVFHDFKKLGVPAADLTTWAQTLGWEALVNRKGTTWRKLDEATRLAVTDIASATALMVAHPSVVKRPVVAWPDGRLTVGFDAAVFASHVS
jgi:arsenate reductase (glutaredoxin)